MSGKPRVLQIIETTGPGGAETVMSQVAEHMNSAGYESVVALTGDGWLNQQLRSKGVRTILLTEDRSMGWRFMARLIRLIHRERIALLHAHLDDTSFFASLAGMLTGRPVIATFHGLIGSFWRDNWKGRLKRSSVARNAKFMVTVSGFLKSEVEQRLGVGSERVKVIYNGVDFERSSRTETRLNLRQKYGVPSDATLIGCVGNVRASKGYEFIIEAAALLSKQGFKFRLLIAGQTGGSLSQRLEEQLRELQITELVQFIGFCEDVEAFMEQIDIYVLPSVTEGLSISTIQAMAAGTPVIVTRSGGPTEIVEDGVSGITVPVGDSAALAEKIEFLAKNEEIARGYAEKGYESVRSKFDIRNSMSAYESLYATLLGNRGRA